MNILVVGSGGREHALVWKLAQSPRVSKIYCAPGNPGIARHAELVPLKANDIAGLRRFAGEHRIDLTVVGPEQPLAEGIADSFGELELPLFGPSKTASALEWSKAFAKEFMHRHAIPTSAHHVFGHGEADAARAYLRACPLPVVLKADGLASGKGVLICRTHDEALSGIGEMMETRTFGAAGTTVVIEEFMEGEEASVFAVADGQRFVCLAPAQDHKRASDGDTGKNTGGMGAYAPTPFVPATLLKTIEDTIIAPTLRGMAAEGNPYRGCLYVGLMLTDAGPRVVEYNCRFGDPETQVVLPLFEGDLASMLIDASHGRLDPALYASPPSIKPAHCVCVVLASRGYPDHYETGYEIQGLQSLEQDQSITVFHAGTRLDGARLVTAGGRVLGITAMTAGGSLDGAIGKAYAAVEKVKFDGMMYRHDIGRKAIARPITH